MMQKKRVYRFVVILFIPITILFLISGIVVYRRVFLEFEQQSQSSLTLITDSIDHSLSYASTLSIDLATQENARLIGRLETIEGTDMLLIKQYAATVQQMAAVNQSVASIYVFFTRSQTVLTQDTLYPFENFYDRELLDRFLMKQNTVWYDCRKIASDDLSYILPREVVTIMRQAPYDADNSDVVVAVNLDMSSLLAGYSHYEQIFLINDYAVIGANGESLNSADVLPQLQKSDDTIGRLSLPDGYLYYSTSDTTGVTGAILVSRKDFSLMIFPRMSFLITGYFASLFLALFFYRMFAAYMDRRSRYLIEKIAGTQTDIPDTDTNEYLDDVISRMVSMNKMLTDNEKRYSFLIQNLIITDIIMGNTGSITDLNERLAYAKLTFDKPFFTGFVCIIMTEGAFLEPDETSRPYSTTLFIKDMLQNELSQDLSVYSALSFTNKIYFFINHDMTQSTLKELLEYRFHQINSQVQNQYDVTLFFSVGTRVESLQDIAQSCYIAGKLSDASNTTEIGDIINNTSSEQISPAFPLTISGSILNGLKNNAKETMLEGLDEYFHHYLIANGYSLDLCKNITVILMTNIINDLWFSNWNIRLEETLSHIAVFSKQKSMEGLMDKTRNFLESLYDLQPIRPLKGGEYPDKYISTVIDYIHANYHRDLTIADIASCVDLNPRYLGELFKETTGKTLVKYLNTVRIEHAKKLLAETATAIKDIAAMVGYNDIHAFIRHFKVLNNMTPTEYRDYFHSRAN